MHEEEFFEMQSTITGAVASVCCQTWILKPFLKKKVKIT
jgi:hypothetical protein